MQVKTSELQGAALDWVVAKCEGIPNMCIVKKTDKTCMYGDVSGIDFPWQPSTDWAQGGPIIERMFREGLEMRQGEPEAGNQRAWARLRDGRYYWHETSPLIAAMRCYVASKLGDEVDIPNGLAA